MASFATNSFTPPILGTSSASCMRLYRAQRDRERVTIQARYAIIGFISSGTYGKVYKGQLRTPTENHATGKDALDSTRGELVAIKKFKPGPFDLQSVFLVSRSEMIWFVRSRGRSQLYRYQSKRLSGNYGPCLTGRLDCNKKLTTSSSS